MHALWHWLWDVNRGATLGVGTLAAFAVCVWATWGDEDARR